MKGHGRVISTMRASLVAFVCLAGFGAGPALAQTEPGELCRDGQVVIVRVSKIADGGSRAAFDKAVVDQLAWYRSHGFRTNRLVSADVLTQDPATRAWSTSASEILTLHFNPPPIGAIKPDAGWSSFVSQLKQNAIVEAERTACLDQPLN